MENREGQPLLLPSFRRRLGSRAQITRALVVPAMVAITALSWVGFGSSSAGAAQPKVAYLYWANNGGGTIGRAELDGSGVDGSFIKAAGTEPCGVSVYAGHLYWGVENSSGIGSIGTADSDGSKPNPNFIKLRRGSKPCDVAIYAGRIYWTSSLPGLPLGRSSLNGTAIDQSFVKDSDMASGACGLAIGDGHIYWADDNGGNIFRSNLDGTDIDPSFITGAQQPCGVALAGGYIYWGNNDGSTVGRAKINGTAVNNNFIKAGVGSEPCGVAIYGSRIYWASQDAEEIGSATLSGTDVNQDLITTGTNSPCGIEVG